MVAHWYCKRPMVVGSNPASLIEKPTPSITCPPASKRYVQIGIISILCKFACIARWRFKIRPSSVVEPEPGLFWSKPPKPRLFWGSRSRLSLLQPYINQTVENNNEQLWAESRSRSCNQKWTGSATLPPSTDPWFPDWYYCRYVLVPSGWYYKNL